MPRSKRRPLVEDLAVVPGEIAVRGLEHDSATIRICSARFYERPESDDFWAAGNQDPKPPPKEKRRRKK
jgi:hypothetical protein